MRAVLLVLVILGSVCISMAGDRVQVDVGGGVVQQDLESDSGGSGLDPVGFFGSVGWLFERGLVIRLSLSKTEDETSSAADFGFGLEPALEESKLTRAQVTVGYLFNKAGLVRPFLHGGLAKLDVDAKITGQSSGGSAQLIDDDASVISLAGGVEVGQEHHTLIFDLAVDQEYEMRAVFGKVEFNITEIQLGYAYRF